MSNRTKADGLTTLKDKGTRYLRYTNGRLSEALEIAIEDMEQIEARDECKIDMENYGKGHIVPDELDRFKREDRLGAVCSVCLAGAALYKTCNLRSPVAIEDGVGRREVQISYIGCGSGLFGFSEGTIFGDVRLDKADKFRLKKTLMVINQVKDKFIHPVYGDDNYKEYLWAVVKALREADL